MPKMEYFSGMGKGLEVLRRINKAVMDHGGEEEDILSVIKDGGEDIAEKLALVLVGKADVQRYSPDHIATTAQSATVRKVALADVKDHNTLEIVATTDSHPYIRRSAMQRMHRQSYLYSVVVRGFKGKPDREAVHAVRRINDQESLTEIALTHGLLSVRVEAIQRMDKVHLSLFLRRVNLKQEVAEDLRVLNAETFIKATNWMTSNFASPIEDDMALKEIEATNIIMPPITMKL